MKKRKNFVFHTVKKGVFLSISEEVNQELRAPVKKTGESEAVCAANNQSAN